MRPAVAAALAFLLAAADCLAGEALRTVRLSVGGHGVTAEVAETEAQRSTGLMYRRQLDEDAGMLFVFPTRNIMAMWMRNTHVPLSVAFLDADGTIINIADMTPLSEDVHASAAPGRYALEMGRGWFRQHGIGPGARVQGLEGLAGSDASGVPR